MKKIWIDLITAPDVPFFNSIINELKKRSNYKIIITIRRYLEVPQLISKYGISDATIIDCFYGKQKITKIFSFLIRSFQLLIFGLKLKPDLSFNFASRAQTLASWLLHIPILNIYDYEGGEIKFINFFSTIIMVPEEIPVEILKKKLLAEKKIRCYPGIKESVYAYDFKIDKKEIEEAGIPTDKIIFIVRMNSIYAHYHSKEKDDFDIELIEYLTGEKDVYVVVLPRYEIQKQKVIEMEKTNKKIILLKKPVSGQNLIWYSDGVISGGGSMIREAVCLEVPAYDMFFGIIGAVEKSLIDSGKVIRLKTNGDFDKLIIKKKQQKDKIKPDRRLLDFIVKTIDEEF